MKAGSARILPISPIEAPTSLHAAGRLLPYGIHFTSSKPHFNLPSKISDSSGKKCQSAANIPAIRFLAALLDTANARSYCPAALPPTRKGRW